VHESTVFDADGHRGWYFFIIFHYFDDIVLILFRIFAIQKELSKNNLLI